VPATDGSIVIPLVFSIALSNRSVRPGSKEAGFKPLELKRSTRRANEPGEFADFSDARLIAGGNNRKGYVRIGHNTTRPSSRSAEVSARPQAKMEQRNEPSWLRLVCCIAAGLLPSMRSHFCESSWLLIVGDYGSRGTLLVSRLFQLFTNRPRRAPHDLLSAPLLVLSQTVRSSDAIKRPTGAVLQC